MNAFSSQNDCCFDVEYLPLKSTDFIFFGVLSTSLPNSTNKGKGELLGNI